MNELDLKQYLIDVKLKRDKIPNTNQYPFSLPAVSKLDTLKLDPLVTFIIGENGSGKSTLLEAIAIACGFNSEGGSKNFKFNTHISHSNLWKYLRISKGVNRPKDGYFFRAESFYNVASEIEKLDEGPGGPPIINAYGGRSLHAQSHGESFFSLFMKRFRGNGLYILDEPEAALSPTRQMSIITRIHNLVQNNSQFIIATHSPLIMAYPNATIYLLSNKGLHKTKYTDTEYYTITRNFINNHEKIINILME